MNIEKILNEALMKEPEFESFPLSLAWQDGFRKGYFQCQLLLKKYLGYIGGIHGSTFLSDSDTFDPEVFELVDEAATLAVAINTSEENRQGI